LELLFSKGVLWFSISAFLKPFFPEGVHPEHVPKAFLPEVQW
jgi:hypothetical protein